MKEKDPLGTACCLHSPSKTQPNRCPFYPKIITTFISCRFSRNSIQRFQKPGVGFPDKRPSLRVKSSASADLISHGTDTVYLFRADGGIEVMFDSADNVAGLDAFAFLGVEVAGQHIAFGPVLFRFANQYVLSCLAVKG